TAPAGPEVIFTARGGMLTVVSFAFAIHRRLRLQFRQPVLVGIARTRERTRTCPLTSAALAQVALRPWRTACRLCAICRQPTAYRLSASRCLTTPHSPGMIFQ